MGRSEARCIRTRLSDVRPPRDPPIPGVWRITFIASAVMYADRTPAGRTPVFLGLPAQELVDAVVSDEFEVLNHAHIVFSSVSSIQMFQTTTGRIVTSKTELHLTFLNDFAVLDFASNNANCLIGICCPATGAFVPFSQIGHANPAVHSAWCDQASLHIWPWTAVAQLVPRKWSTKLANSSRSSHPSFR